MLYSMSLSLIFIFLANVNSRRCPDRTFIEQNLLDVHVPGAVMIVVNRTDILYQEAFGHQSFLPTQLMNVDTSIFVLASISKTFIGIAVMQLVESNLLDLDVDINCYLLPSDPNISHPFYPSHSITLRQLLSHSASINRNDETEYMFYQTGDEALAKISLEEACFTYLSHKASNWLPDPPGTVTLYSNVGSSLAALVIERVTKMSYEQYVRDKILVPLGIDVTKASYRLSNIEDQTNLVRHYSFNSSQLPEWNRLLPQLKVIQVKI